MAERERGALLLAAVAGILWGIFIAIVAWRFDGAEVVLLQGWIFGGAWLCGWIAGRPLTGAAAGFIFVGTAIWTFELLPPWGFEHSAPKQYPATDQAAVVAAFDAADVVLMTTHLAGALCGLGGALWAAVLAGRPEEETPAAPEPRPLPPLTERSYEPLWGEPGPERPLPEAANVPEPPPPGGAEGRSALVPRRRIAAAALAVAALGTDAALGLLFFSYTDTQEMGAWLFAVGAAAAAAYFGRRYALAALAAGVIIASAFAAVQDAEYGDRGFEVTVIR